MHCIRLTEPGKEREFLRTAYIALADFQALSLHEKESLDAWNSSLNISSGAQNLDDLRKEAQKLSTSGDDVIRVHERVSAECASLLRELQVAGF
jgi:hypothetical protein